LKFLEWQPTQWAPEFFSRLSRHFSPAYFAEFQLEEKSLKIKPTINQSKNSLKNPRICPRIFYMGKKEIITLSPEYIASRIFLIRGEKVMIDKDLAELYGVKTSALNQAVKRNLKRFPKDFMFQIDKQEFKNWKSQIVISNKERMGLRKRPLVFTELGVAMLSSVLNSERAIQVNIQIMRAFTKLRELLSTHKELRHKIEAMEKNYDKKFRVVFDVIKQLLLEEPESKRKMGFKAK